MILLNLDTTKQQALLQLSNHGNLNSVTIDGKEKHSQTLLPQVEELLQKTKTTLNSVDVFACITGPGSFTGIRIGMATVKAWAAALGKPVVSANVFEVVAPVVENGTMLLVCTSSSYYYAKVVAGKVAEYGVLEAEKLNEFLTGEKVFCLLEEQQSIALAYKNFETIKNYPYFVYQHFTNLATNKQFTNTTQFEPFYIQVSQAERQVKK